MTLSAESDSLAVLAAFLGVLAFVSALDVVVFRTANRMSAHLDESRMLVTEKIFGFLLAATSTAPEISRALAAIVQWFQRP